MALSFERYQAFCSPFEHKARFWPYFVTGVTTSITWYVMCMFNFEFCYDDYGAGDIVYFASTNLFSNPCYYDAFYYFIEVCSISSCFLIVLLNIKIYLQLKSVKNSSKYKSARVIFMIVITFLFCHGVRIVVITFGTNLHIKEYWEYYVLQEER